jgi:hypothetical protein
MEIKKPEGYKILKVGDDLLIINRNENCSGCGRALTERYPLHADDGTGLLDWRGVESPRWALDVKSLAVLENKLEIEFTDECSARIGRDTLTVMRIPASDAKISFACDVGDAVIDHLIDSGLVKAEVLYSKQWLENPNQDVADGDDPSGFTEAGRELFEFVYSLLID